MDYDILVSKMSEVFDMNDVDEINEAIRFIREYRDTVVRMSKAEKEDRQKRALVYQNRLNRLRKSCNISLQGLADKLNVSKAYAARLCDMSTKLPYFRMKQLQELFKTEYNVY